MAQDLFAYCTTCQTMTRQRESDELSGSRYWYDQRWGVFCERCAVVRMIDNYDPSDIGYELRCLYAEGEGSELILNPSYPDVFTGRHLKMHQHNHRLLYGIEPHHFADGCALAMVG